jgi:hypothetical protein
MPWRHWTGSIWPTWPIAASANCPAASASGCSSPGPWSRGPGCSCTRRADRQHRFQRDRRSFTRLLKRLNRDVTIVVVSHDLLVISTYVKSVACVNRRLHYHRQAEITGDMLETMYPCTVEDVCPVELVTHGHLPHRVLQQHHKE